MIKIRALRKGAVLHQVIFLEPHKWTLFHNDESPSPWAPRWEYVDSAKPKPMLEEPWQFAKSSKFE